MNALRTYIEFNHELKAHKLRRVVDSSASVRHLKGALTMTAEKATALRQGQEASVAHSAASVAQAASREAPVGQAGLE
jgi:hypothetical protein